MSLSVNKMDVAESSFRSWVSEDTIPKYHMLICSEDTLSHAIEKVFITVARWRLSNHQRLECLLNRLFRRSSKKTSTFCIISICEGNPPVTDIYIKNRRPVVSHARHSSQKMTDHRQSIPLTFVLLLVVSSVPGEKTYSGWYIVSTALGKCVSNGVTAVLR